MRLERIAAALAAEPAPIPLVSSEVARAAILRRSADAGSRAASARLPSSDAVAAAFSEPCEPALLLHRPPTPPPAAYSRWERGDGSSPAPACMHAAAVEEQTGRACLRSPSPQPAAEPASAQPARFRAQSREHSEEVFLTPASSASCEEASPPRRASIYAQASLADWGQSAARRSRERLSQSSAGSSGCGSPSPLPSLKPFPPPATMVVHSPTWSFAAASGPPSPREQQQQLPVSSLPPVSPAPASIPADKPSDNAAKPSAGERQPSPPKTAAKAEPAAQSFAAAGEPNLDRIVFQPAKLSRFAASAALQEARASMAAAVEVAADSAAQVPAAAEAAAAPCTPAAAQQQEAAVAVHASGPAAAAAPVQPAMAAADMHAQPERGADGASSPQPDKKAASPFDRYKRSAAIAEHGVAAPGHAASDKCAAERAESSSSDDHGAMKKPGSDWGWDSGSDSAGDKFDDAPECDDRKTAGCAERAAVEGPGHAQPLLAAPKAGEAAGQAASVHAEAQSERAAGIAQPSCGDPTAAAGCPQPLHAQAAGDASAKIGEALSEGLLRTGPERDLDDLIRHCLPERDEPDLAVAGGSSLQACVKVPQCDRKSRSLHAFIVGMAV